MSDNGVIISTKEMYAVLQEIKSQVSIIQTEVRNIGATDERSRQALELANDALQKAAELEKQIDKVERWYWWIIGTLLTTILGIVSGFIFTFIK
ncbi:hypothetical protein SAMN05444392_102267 [Seinonella peptonophila]|uniref:Haemolysin XhlA n=1 Tax=Seinonella peptonophila TaxID=112248 RepID=A0A1M4VAP9_9BACL|nr:hypothetical protein [Seinonella peptonophila]SHE66034.1 hypothetical protein SAMN05444392_102267 [Seinonella peptonophila]